MTTRVIKIVIDSSGAKRGGKDVQTALAGIDRSAKKARKPVNDTSKSIKKLGENAKKSAPATKSLRDSLKQVEGRAKGVDNAFKGLRAGLAGAALFIAAREIIESADAWQSLQGQLKLVTDSEFELAATTQTLFDISQRTRQSLEATSSLYIRLGRSTDFTSERVAQLTETIGQTIAISRASPQAAQAALFQLGQGFAAGALRGEELNSVLEQTPELAKAIADGLGVTTGELRVLGAEGKLTAETVAGALETSAEQVNKDFATIPLTVGDALTRVGNSLAFFIGKVDEGVGATSALASTLDTASKIVQGLGILISNQSGFGARYDQITEQIGDAEQALRDLEAAASGFESTSQSNFGGFRIVPEGEREKAQEAIQAAKDALQELIDLRDEITLNGGLTDAEREAQRIDDLKASAAKAADALNSLFLSDSTDDILGNAIAAARVELVKLQAELDDGLIDQAEFNRLSTLIDSSIGGASQRAADQFVTSFESGREKAQAQMELLNDFVGNGLIDEDVASRIRERLESALELPEDPLQQAADRFVDSFKTAAERTQEQIDTLDDYVEKNLIDAETAQTIRERLEKTLAKELVIPVAVDVQALEDTEQKIADLQGRIQAFSEGGSEGLLAFDAFIEARDIIAELGDEATVTVDELARMIATEKELENVLSDMTGEVQKQGDAIEDFWRKARENSQDIFSDFLASGFEDMDDFEAEFSQMLLRLASQALSAQIFEKLFGAAAGAGGGGGGSGGLFGFLTSSIGSFFGGAADGADVGKGDFGIVGETGPEVFQAPTAGRIVPNGNNMPPPQVNVGGPTIVNAIDDGDIVSAFNRGGGGKTILNYVSENAAAFRQGLGIQ